MRSETRLRRTLVVALSAAAVAVGGACKGGGDEGGGDEGGGSAEGEPKTEKSGDESGSGDKGGEGRKKGGGDKAAVGVEMPDSVLMVGAIPSLKKALGDAEELGRMVLPNQLPPDLTSLAMEGVKSGLGLADATWLDKEAPLAQFVANPDAYGDKPASFVLPFADEKKAVLKGLKDSASEDVDGHAAKYDHAGTTWYLDFAKGRAVFTPHADAFGDTKGFVKELAGWTPERLVEVHVNMDQVAKRYGSEIEQAFRTEAQRWGGTAPTDMDLGKMLEEEADLLKQALRESQRASFTLHREGSDLRTAIQLRPKKGTDAASLVDTLAETSVSGADALPASTWMGMGNGVDTQKFQTLQRIQSAAVEAYAPLLELDDEEKKRLQKLMGRTRELYEGHSLGGFYVEGEFPMAFVGYAEVSDADEHRKVQGKLLSLLFDKGWSLAKEEMSGGGQQIPPPLKGVDSFPKLVEKVQPMLDEQGVTLETIDEERDGVYVQAVRLGADWEAMDLQPGPKRIMKKMGDTVELAAAYGEGRVATGVGPEGIERAIALSKGESIGEGAKALSDALGGRAMAMTIRPGAAMEAFAFVPGLKSKKSGIEKLSNDRAFQFTGGSSGDELTFTVSTPVDHVGELVQLFQGK